MDVAASVIAIVEISANITVWCVQYVRDVAHEAEQATSLCQEVAALQTVLARLQSPAVSGETVRQLEPVLKLCLSDVTALQKRLEPAQGWRRTQQKLVWPFKKRAEFKVAVEKLQRHVSLFTAALSVDLSTLPAQISEHITTLSQLQISHHAEVLTEFDNLRRTLDDTHYNDLRREKESLSADQQEETLKWLKVVDYDSNFIQNLELLHSQTGQWFTQSRYFRRWLDVGSVTRKNVWLCGQAGSGKTVLMSAIVGEAKRHVQALQDMVRPGLKICIAYFYFDFRDHLKRVSQSLLYSILHQLAAQSSIFPQSLIDKKKRSASHGSLSLSELTKELSRVGAGFDHFMLFLDALDECQDFPELLKVLKELTRMLPRLSLIVSSRDELEIKRGIENLGFERYPISADSVDSDIASYVKDVVEKDEKNRFTKFPETLKQLVVNNLTASSQGMFRWAQCQVDEVSRYRSVKEVHEALATLPKTLNETYQRMLESMNESEKKWAKRALVWLVGARFPMTLGMLAEAVAVDLQDFDIDDDDRLFDPEQLLEICRSLVITVKEQYEPKSRIISLAHFSVEQYLRSPEATLWFLPSAYVELCLAKACLAYSISPIWEPICERWTKEEGIEEEDLIAIAHTDTVRFAEYCSVYLFEHLQYPGVESAALPFLLNIVVSERFKNFERNCAVFRVLAGLQWVLLGHQGRTIALQRETLRLSYTSSFVAKAIMYDLNATALRLIDLDIDTAVVDASSSSAISFLTAKRAVIHVRRLLSVTRKRFEATAMSDSAETEPASAQSAIKILGMGLLVAIAADEHEIMNVLIDEMLHYISLFGVHQQLATKIGKLAAIGAILSSAEGNSNALVRLLQIGSSYSGLNQSEEELVQQALYCACKHGRQDCVSYLLSHGYQPKRRVLSPKSEDLLYAARDELMSVATRSWLSYCDSLYLLELLRGYHDSDIDKTYPRAAASNALDAALAANHTSIAQMLMDVGMSVPSAGSAEKCIDLIDASNKKDLNTMKALLASGADPNMEMEMSRLRTPLIAALSAGWTQPDGCYNAVLELLQHGADVSKHVQGAIHKPKFPTRNWDMRPGSPFMSAVEACTEYDGREKSEAEEVFRLLEDFNVLQEINQYVSSDDFGTPLIAAAALGQPWLVDYLLNHGAQADLQGQPTSDWCFPALAAIYGRHPQLGLRLLEHEGYETLKRAPEKWAKCFIFVCAQVESTSTSSWDELFTALLDRGIDSNYIADIDDDWCEDYDDRGSYEPPALFGNAIIAACTSGALLVVKALLEKGVDEKAPFARLCGTCLAAACGSGNVELVKFFIDKGYDVNEVTTRCRYWCPLVAAVFRTSYKTKEVVELLLERGAMADIQYQSSNGVVSDEDLEIMVCTKHTSWHHTLMLCRMWQDCRITGASPIRRHPLFHGSAFIAAVADRKVDAMKSLAARGADVNMEVRAGFYPTGMFATLDMKKAYKVQYPLTKLGGTPISPSQMLDYPSPFRALFGDTDHFENSALLTRPGSFWGNMLTLAVNVKVAVPYLLEQNADPDEVVPGSFYGSAMVAAAALLQAHAVLAFLEHGASINKVASEGAFGTPLIAVCAGPPEYLFKYSFYKEFNLNDPDEWEQVQLDLMEILLDAGADPNLTYGSLSPLIALVCSTSTKKIHGLKMLLERGADPRIALPRYSFEASRPRRTAISLLQHGLLAIWQ